MPQLDNDKILGRILRSTIGVISRRTSETYANVVIGNVVNELAERYSFLNYVEIQGSKYTEIFNVVDIKPEINYIEKEEISKATKEFIEKITKSMGKSAGYYLIREIKEDLPFDYEKSIKELGIDLDILQLKFITEIKQTYKYQIENAEVLRYTLKILFNILDHELGSNNSFSIIHELVSRLSIEYRVLKYVKINDIRSIQGVDVVTIAPEINEIEPTTVGVAIQKVIQEINNSYGEKRSGFSLIEKLKNSFNADYLFKLGKIGVNLDVIQFKKELILKHVLKALVNVLSESSTQSYAMLIVDNILRKFVGTFEYLKLIKIDSMRYSEGLEAITVSPDIESVRPSELGIGIQKIVEDIIRSLGEDASLEFIGKFKQRLGKAYILRIEEMGVNLHIMELKQNLMW